MTISEYQKNFSLVHRLWGVYGWGGGGQTSVEGAVYTVSPVRWDTYFQANRVENQKLNQTTAEPAVWLSFWFSTQSSADIVTN